MGNGELWPPTESKPLNWLPKILSQLITSARRLSQYWPYAQKWLRFENTCPMSAIPSVNRWPKTKLPYINFGANPSTGGFWANITLNYFYIRTYTFFSGNNPQIRPFDRFWRVMIQKMRNHARMCLFGVTKIKSDIYPLFRAPKRRFLAKKQT